MAYSTGSDSLNGLQLFDLLRTEMLVTSRVAWSSSFGSTHTVLSVQPLGRARASLRWCKVLPGGHFLQANGGTNGGDAGGTVISSISILSSTKSHLFLSLTTLLPNAAHRFSRPICGQGTRRKMVVHDSRRRHQSALPRNRTTSGLAVWGRIVIDRLPSHVTCP